MKTKELVFVHGFINCNMKVKYRLSTDYDQQKERNITEHI